jgi:hypothetical protein
MAETDAGVKAAADFRAYVEDMLGNGAAKDIPDEVLREVLSYAVKAFAAKVEDTGEEFPAVDTAVVTATDGATAACGIIRAVDLNMFDITMWFNRAGSGAGSRGG